MTRLSRTLLALALAAALAAPALALAQEITTSRGVRTLARTEGFNSEQQYRQAARLAEDVLSELMQDINAFDSAQTAAVSDAAAIPDSVKKAKAEYAAAKSSFDAANQQYRDSVAAFQQRQSALESEVQQQRAQAATLEALPSAQRDHQEVVRLNDWANRIASTRTQIQGEQKALLAEHDRMEQERAKLAQKRTDMEAKLKGTRDTTVGQLGSAKTKRAAAYRDLRATVDYLNVIRKEQARLTGKPAPPMAALDQATTKLRRYEANASSVKK